MRIATIGIDAITQMNPTTTGRDNPSRNNCPRAKEIPNTATMSIHRLVVIRGNSIAMVSTTLLGDSIRGESSSAVSLA